MQKNERLLDQLRELLPEYMAQKRMVVGSRGTKKIRCINPEHNDATPSMSYHPKSRKLHCFGCGVSYDLFDLIRMDYPECDSFPRQVKKACEIFGLPFPKDFGRTEESLSQTAEKQRVTVRRVQSPPIQPEAQLADYNSMIEEGIAKYGAGGGYFAARGLSQRICERFRLYQTEERAYIPIYRAGSCVSYCARALKEEVEPRYKNSSGPMGIFGADYFIGSGKGGCLFVTEAAFDALSAEECGFQAVALCGTGNVRKFLSLCAENPAAANAYTLVAAGDNDPAGRRMNRELRDGLAALGLGCTVLTLPDNVKDLNELLMNDRTCLESCLAGAVDADRQAYTHTSAAGTVDELLDFSQRRASRCAVPTGFGQLDRVLDGGLYAGLYIIGAISSIGKTSFLLQIADEIAAAGTDVLYFSLEMSRLELMAKSISRLSWQMDQTAQRVEALTAREVLRFDAQTDKRRAPLFESALHTYRRTGENLFLREGIAEIGALEIRDAVREHIRLRGRKPVVMVDYLQILKPADPRASDKQNTDRAVVELKRISRDFDLPVVAVSSFNRENYRNAVSMEAFKESGAVEYSSDVLFGMQLSGAGEQGFDVNAAKQRAPRAVELVMLKNRNGVPFARLGYDYHAKFSCFVEGRSTRKG